MSVKLCMDGFGFTLCLHDSKDRFLTRPYLERSKRVIHPERLITVTAFWVKGSGINWCQYHAFPKRLCTGFCQESTESLLEASCVQHSWLVHKGGNRMKPQSATASLVMYYIAPLVRSYSSQRGLR